MTNFINLIELENLFANETNLASLVFEPDEKKSFTLSNYDLRNTAYTDLGTKLNDDAIYAIMERNMLPATLTGVLLINWHTEAIGSEEHFYAALKVSHPYILFVRLKLPLRSASLQQKSTWSWPQTASTD